ncbi:MAG TPA: hypothetical protein VGJ00_08295 [Rhabdochlamydiaceae bacterium]|jgi:hypothetical protein
MATLVKKRPLSEHQAAPSPHFVSGNWRTQSIAGSDTGSDSIITIPVLSQNESPTLAKRQVTPMDKLYTLQVAQHQQVSNRVLFTIVMLIFTVVALGFFTSFLISAPSLDASHILNPQILGSGISSVLGGILFVIGLYYTKKKSSEFDTEILFQAKKYFESYRGIRTGEIETYMDSYNKTCDLDNDNEERYLEICRQLGLIEQDSSGYYRLKHQSQTIASEAYSTTTPNYIYENYADTRKNIMIYPEIQRAIDDLEKMVNFRRLTEDEHFNRFRDNVLFLNAKIDQLRKLDNCVSNTHITKNSLEEEMRKITETPLETEENQRATKLVAMRDVLDQLTKKLRN